MRRENGFTLVELLVVVLIVTILAAIALPLYVSQRAKAQDAEAKRMASTVALALSVHHQERETFAGAGRDELARIEPAIRAARGLAVDGTRTTYEIAVDSAAGTTFTIAHDPGGTERTCDHPGRAGCPGGGTW